MTALEGRKMPRAGGSAVEAGGARTDGGHHDRENVLSALHDDSG
jgi:hypothetical protein